MLASVLSVGECKSIVSTREEGLNTRVMEIARHGIVCGVVEAQLPVVFSCSVFTMAYTKRTIEDGKFVC